MNAIPVIETKTLKTFDRVVISLTPRQVFILAAILRKSYLPEAVIAVNETSRENWVSVGFPPQVAGQVSEKETAVITEELYHSLREALADGYDSLA